MQALGGDCGRSEGAAQYVGAVLLSWLTGKSFMTFDALFNMKYDTELL